MKRRLPTRCVHSRTIPFYRPAALTLLLGAITVNVAGCPTGGLPDSTYDRGFDAGFAQDSWYYTGYADSWETVGAAPIFYRGGTIPFYDEDTYRAGYWDGVWYAYNDGYFVAYRYAFIIGFSEGYFVTFRRQYLEILANDDHIEYRNGGFDDGYNDGFTEGTFFGAFDYEAGLPFDWLSAFLDWQDGLDIYFEEIDEGTGQFGFVILYEWGTDPTEPLAKSIRGAKNRNEFRPWMKYGGKQAIDFARPLTTEQRAALSVNPPTTPRSDIPLALDTTWLQRIEAYNNAKSITLQTRRGELGEAAKRTFAP